MSIPPPIRDLGLRPGELSFACAVGDHELCDGCPTCHCHCRVCFPPALAVAIASFRRGWIVYQRCGRLELIFDGPRYCHVTPL